jgi:RNA polymerase sigma-70 factor (ECF subfamily)
MFSTPGSPARFAGEGENAFGAVRLAHLRVDGRLRQCATDRDSGARMTLPKHSSAAPVPSEREGAASAFGSAVDDRLDRLYREHSPSLVRQLTRKTGCRDLALELANETFVRLLRMAPGKIGRIEHPEAFLRKVSANLLRDWGRSNTLGHRSRTSLEVIAEQQLDQVAVLESRDTLRRLEHAVGKLKPKTRRIFLAHRIDGLTYSQIAEETGLSIKGVEKQMSKAIAKIDRLLDRD